MKIGIITPTHNRPDCIRSLVLQMVNQIKQPDVVCIHHNGNKESYDWAIKDIVTNFKVIWIHTPEIINQHLWYSVPLQKLIEEECTHFLWCDHDDIYYSNHIEAIISTLDNNQVDFTVSNNVGVLLLKESEYAYTDSIAFTSHDPGGMSSSMGFKRNFACELLKDLNNPFNEKYCYTDQIVSRVTMNKFKCLVNSNNTATYVASSSTVSSSEWVK